MSDKNENPRPLSELLNTVASRLRRVDLRVIDQVRELWPKIVEPAIAQHCVPEFIKDGVLIIRVPSGAFAQRINSDRELILNGLLALGERAPSSLRTVLAKP